ncbi:MAG: TatD family hydrolase [Candidatus Paceibacterota bacterium]|jgi:TatD DNase family protein
MKYIDIHCHLDSKDFESDREAILTRMKESGVGAITIGTDLENSKKAVEIAEANQNIWATIGVHPDHITSPRSAVRNDPLLEAGEGKNEALPLHLGEGRSHEVGWDEVEFEELVKSPKVVAIGECGLDYFEHRSLGEGSLVQEEKNKQKELFIEQIEFALKHDKPLMLHVRPARLASESVAGGDAYDDALDILESYHKTYGEKLRGDVHFFAGDVTVAKRFLDLDFAMSFTGVVTFLPRRSSAKEGTHDYDEVIKYIPQDLIMSETDAPWVAPVPFRGKRNEPVYVIEVIKKLAEIRGESFEDLNSAILNNAKRVFGIAF